MSTALRQDDTVFPPQPPLVLCWDQDENPLPRRSVRPLTQGDGGTDAPPWIQTGAAAHPFDFCWHVERLCHDVCRRCADLNHVDTSRILFAVTQARNDRALGLQARVTPLRFRDGRLRRQRGGVTYQVQRYVIDQQDMLYLMTFCLPRFQDQDFDEKFITLFHELFHIGPAFDGDLRRHDGRYPYHSHSQRQYDRQMAGLAREYLSGGPDARLHAFLRLTFRQLQSRHRSVVGVMVPRPKIIPVIAATDGPERENETAHKAG